MKVLTLAIFSGILFFLLSPTTFFRFPPNGSKFAVAAVHAFLFAFIFYFGYKYISSSSIMEGYTYACMNQCKVKTACKAEGATHKNTPDNENNKQNGWVEYKCTKKVRTDPESLSGHYWKVNSQEKPFPSGNSGKWTNQNNINQ
jgi:hypothetical protein